jgi:sensor domain CHASE-containing protein
MSLLKKTVIVTGFTLIALIIVLYAASQAILMNSVKNMEERAVNENIKRALDVLADELSTMNDIAADWAAWDDTYEFTQNAGDEYIESNLVDTTFTGLKINLIVYVDTSGQVVFGKGVDMNNGNRVFPIQEALRDHFVVNDPILNHPDPRSSLTGLVLLPEGPLLVASRPIVTSAYEGPIRGTFIMGRYLNEVEIKKLEDKAHLSLTIRTFKAPSV